MLEISAAATAAPTAQKDDPLAALYELLMCTGMRKGEALALHWVDVDLDRKLLFVRYSRALQPPGAAHRTDVAAARTEEYRQLCGRQPQGLGGRLAAAAGNARVRVRGRS